MAGVNVKSEIKPLKKVLLHRPGKELLNLTPNTLEELLFDDIPFLKVAQEEHDAFAQALRDNGVEVVYLEDLTAEVLAADSELREKFLLQWIDEAGIKTERYRKIIFDYMQENYPDAKDFVLKTMEGINLTELHTDKSNSLVDLVSEASKMVVAPMPNLYFTRDPFAMIGNGVSINRMYSVTRNRETIYGEYIFNYHPDFQGTPQYYSRYNTFHIEGGDILNINEHVLAIGISQRTEPDAIDGIAHNIFNDPTSPVDTILAFNIPNNRAMMQVHHPSRHHGPAVRVRDHARGRRHQGARDQRSARADPGEVHRHAGDADPLRRWRPHRRRARAVERRLQHAVHRPWSRGCLRAQRRHERRAAQEQHRRYRDPLGRAVPRPWRPALHEHAGRARGLIVFIGEAAGSIGLPFGQLAKRRAARSFPSVSPLRSV